MRRISLLILSLLITTYSFSKEIKFTERTNSSVESFIGNEAYFSIDKIEVTEVESFDPGPIVDNIGSIIKVIDKMLVLGEKVIKIIEKGKPVVDVDLNSKAHINIIPNIKGNKPADTFREMSNWEAPVSKTYEVRYKNKLGQNVISFKYTVHFQHGGKLDGVGSYLAGVHISASDVSVAWGYNFNATSKFINATNRGSSENPVAGATLRVEYSVKTLLKSTDASESFHVDGFGKITKI